MTQLPISLTEFILEDQRNYPHATGSFTMLLLQLAYAGKIIASHIRKAGLVDILGKTGEKNASADEVISLDTFSNSLLVDTLSASGEVAAVGSEEMEDIHIVEKRKQGKYTVFVDPLDGSKNTAFNLTVGTIFSIFRHEENLLQPGEKQVAAGYILYGTSCMFVYSCGHGVNGFTLDPSVGSFLLSHPDIKIPPFANVYSINEGNQSLWHTPTTGYIKSIKIPDPKRQRPYSLRYVGSLVSDVHRTLLQGGIFLYPTDTRHPEGKLRLLLEVNPMSYLIKQAGGMALAEDVDPLKIIPGSLHERAPLIVGGRENVEEYASFRTSKKRH